MNKIFKKIDKKDERKYIKIIDRSSTEKLPDKLKFKNGVEVLNNFDWQDITLRKKDGEELNISSMLPEGFEMFLNKEYANFAHYDFENDDKFIYAGYISNESDLLTWLHEIGHTWDYIKNPDLYIDNGKSMQKLAFRERNAWAWALKKMIELRKNGFVDKSCTNKKLIDEAKAWLYSYAESYGYDKEHVLFLNKSLQDED